MSFLIGTVVVLAIIFFMIASPGFRIFAFAVLGIGGIGILVLIENGNKERQQRQQQIAQREQVAITSIRLEDLSLSGVSLDKEHDGWTLKGTVTNNSKFNLEGLRFQVTMQDCRDSCKIIGQETTSAQNPDYLDRNKPLVPAGQVRLFKTYNMKFHNMPPAPDPRWQYKITEIRAAF